MQSKLIYYIGLSVFCSLFILSSTAAAQCTDGRIACSHPCDANTRPTCKDSKGSGAKPHCVTPRFCRDGRAHTASGCGAGWAARGHNCSGAERASGCQDKKGPNGEICVRFGGTNVAHGGGCSPGWTPRNAKCSPHERAQRGCQDLRAANGALCIRFTR